MNADQTVIPFYFLIDTSESEGHSLLEFANSFLNKVFLEIVTDPLVDQLVRMSVLDMGQTPTVALPLSRTSDLLGLPGLVPTGSLSLGGSLETLKKVVSDDVDRLKDEGFRVYRPVVMVFLAHESDDEWRRANRDISDRLSFRYAPNIFCFGTGAASVSDVREIASTSNGQVDASVANFLDLGIGSDPLARSIVQNFFVDVLRGIRQARAASGPEYRIPSAIPGVTPADEITRHSSGSAVDGDDTVSAPELSTDEVEEEQRVTVLPFYVVCDEGSLSEGDSVESVNRGIGEVFREILADPLVSEKARVGIVAFSDSAQLILPLSSLAAVDRVPGCRPGQGSSYSAVFRLLRARIESDMSQLMSDGFRVHRPVAFFMSNGRPTDSDWRDVREELVSKEFKFWPNIVCFGLANSDVGVLKDVATSIPGTNGAAFVIYSETWVSPGAVVREFLRPLTAS